MDEANISSCANCGAAANERCGGCKAIKYCSAACQKKNWLVHKISCGKDGINLVVHRAGQLLQDLFFIMREATYENEITGIKEEGNILIIQDAPIVAGKPTPFANHLMHNASQKKMALSAFTCEEPFAFFHDVLVQMLAGTGVKVHVLWVDMKPPAKKVRVRIAQGLQRDSTFYLHAVVRISSIDGMTWIVDVTGPQYGIFKTCWPEVVYMKQHVVKVTESKSIGDHKADYEKKPYSFLRPLWKATGKIEAAIPAWKSETSLTLDTLLRKDDTGFQKNSKKLTDYVRKALGMVVADAIASEKTDTVTRVDLTKKEESQKGLDDITVLKEDPSVDQSIKNVGDLSKPAGCNNVDHEPGACPDDEDSDFDYDEDDDDGYEDDYYGEDLLDRSAEVRSYGRLHR